ncbi:MAG: LuxR family transcriptional regulator [Halioglobus sp.]|nr:LuxR family transcriptional regulator [Halioglobus sp.]
MSARISAVLVVQEDGVVSDQNRVALRLLGRKTGKYCWDVVGGLEGAEGLPCRTGCVRQLLDAGMDHAAHTPFRYAGQGYHLSCVPIEGAVVCALTRNTDDSPEHWQELTPRERSILELLAGGETTATAAVVLGIREATVRSHVENMRSKMGAGTRAAIVAKGFQLGYLS